VGEVRIEYSILVGKPEVTRPLERSRQDDNKMNVREVCCVVVYWTDHNDREVYGITVFAYPNTEVVVSNPTRGMDSLFVLSCVGSGLAAG
jgi:hypothetical protein